MFTGLCSQTLVVSFRHMYLILKGCEFRQFLGGGAINNSKYVKIPTKTKLLISNGIAFTVGYQVLPYAPARLLELLGVYATVMVMSVTHDNLL